MTQKPPPAGSASHPLHQLLDVGNGEVIAIIGAGGKHTVMTRLSQELAGTGRSVILTSTTNLHRNADFAQVATVLVGDRSDWRYQLNVALAKHRRVILVQSQIGPNMYQGIGADTIDVVSTIAPRAVVLIKADGARKRLLKAPGTDEPVYPQHVDLCVLILSLAAIGKPLNEKYVHRIDHVRALTRGLTIDSQTLIDVILGANGYARHLPPGGRTALYLSNCTTKSLVEATRTISEQTQHMFQIRLAGDTIEGLFFVP